MCFGCQNTTANSHIVEGSDFSANSFKLLKLKEVQCKKETENVDLQNKSCILALKAT